MTAMTKEENNQAHERRRKRHIEGLIRRLNKNDDREEAIKEVIRAAKNMTIEEAIKNGGLWTDGKYLWLRQIRLCKLPIYQRGERP